MAFSLCGHAAAKPSADLCVPGNGNRTLRSSLSRGGACARTWLVVGRGGTDGKSAWTNRPRATDLESRVAGEGDCAFNHQPLHLVDSFPVLSLRRVAIFPARRFSLRLGDAAHHHTVFGSLPCVTF